MADSMLILKPASGGPPIVCCVELVARGVVQGVSPGDPCAHVQLTATPASVRQARAFLAEHAGDLDDDSSNAAAICASELVTNSVLHARTPIVFGVTRGSDRLLVTVADGSVDVPQPAPPDDERPSGRGLVLVAALAQEWGVQDEEDGKTVWFTVPRVMSE